MTTFALSWILTYLLHSTLLLTVAWAAWRLLPDEALAVKETLWRGALLGGLLTASLQSGLGVEPGSFGWSLDSQRAEPVVSASLAELPAAPGAEMWRPGSSPSAEPTSRRQALPDEALGSSTPSSRRGAPGWPFWLTVAWAVGASSLTLWLAASFLFLARRLADRRPVVSGPLPTLLHALAKSHPSDRVALSASGRIGSPLAFGIRRPEICLPERVAEGMSEAEQELILAHELAHHARRDPAWLVVTRLLESLFFFQPLNRLARRRLQEIAEYRCDDWAVSRTGRPVTLARCLAEVAEWNLGRGARLPVPTLAVERHRLGRRVGRLLDRAYPFPPVRRPRWLGVAMTGALVAVVLLAPGVSSGHATPPAAPPEPAAAPAPAPAPVQQPAWRAPAPPMTPAVPAPDSLPAPSTPGVGPIAVAPVPAVPRVAPAPKVAPVAPVRPVAPLVESPEVVVPSAPSIAVAPVPVVSAAPVVPMTAPVAAVPGVVPTPPAAVSGPSRPAPPAPPSPEDGEWVIEGGGAGLVTPILDRLPTVAPVARVAAVTTFDEGWSDVVVAGGPALSDEILAVVDSALETAELVRLSAVDSERLTELSRRLAELSVPDPQALARVEELSEELALHSRMDPEAMARIEALSRRMADLSEPDPELRARFESLAERMVEDGFLSDEERRELLDRRRALLEGARIDREEMERVRAEIRREMEIARPDREKLERIRAEIRRELERSRPERQEVDRIREEIRREIRLDEKERQALREQREEVRRRIEGLHEEERQRLRERLEIERRELERRRERLNDEGERIREERRRVEDGGAG